MTSTFRHWRHLDRDVPLARHLHLERQDAKLLSDCWDESPPANEVPSSEMPGGLWDEAFSLSYDHTSWRTISSLAGFFTEYREWQREQMRDKHEARFGRAPISRARPICMIDGKPLSMDEVMERLHKTVWKLHKIRAGQDVPFVQFWEMVVFTVRIMGSDPEPCRCTSVLGSSDHDPGPGPN